MHPIIFGLKRAHLSATNFLRRKLRRAFGLTQARFDVLYLILRGYDRQRDVRRILALASSTISEMFETLERLGLILRSRCGRDRRARLAALTEEGKKVSIACTDAWIYRRAGVRMMRNIFNWERDSSRALRQMDDFGGHLLGVESWFAPFVSENPYPAFQPAELVTLIPRTGTTR
jgi:DNA-binding MarR family transcriptional regulator